MNLQERWRDQKMVSEPAGSSQDEQRVGSHNHPHHHHHDAHHHPPATAPSTSPETRSRRPTLISALTTRIEILSTQLPKNYIAPLSGACAGVTSGIVTCPLDVIKTKLQAQGGFTRRRGMMPGQLLYRGMIGTGRTIWRDDGIRGLYQGLGPMLLGYLPTWAVYLAVYDRSRVFYYESTDNWWLSRGYASVTAGACSTIVTNPIWVVKTRLMSQSLKSNSEGYRAPWQYSGAIDAVKKMYRNEGIFAFYSGLTAALLGLTHVAIQFPLYEYLKLAFTGYGIGEHPEDGSSHWASISCATFLSKICASTITYPHEVLRTRLQTQQRSPSAYADDMTFRGSTDGRPQAQGPRRTGAASSDGMPNRPYGGIIKTCKTILMEEGWRAFYSGIATNLFRAVPAAMTTMLTYEFLQQLIDDLQHEGARKQLEYADSV